ncbi:MAG: tetratricopeptide repeat protein, partial [Flavobacteriales bacterium]|nr:tetratricopeptide repeat protein [Flavobacteriales bacterium]
LCALTAIAGAQVNVDSVLTLVENAPDDTTKMWHYRDLAQHLMNQDSEQALLYANKSLALAQSSNHLLGQAKCFYMVGLGHDFAGRTEDAVKNITSSLKLYEQLGDQVQVGNMYNSIGVAYYYGEDFALALENYLKAAAIHEEEGSYNQLSRSLINIGVIYRAENRYEEAIKIYHKSLAIKTEEGDKLGMANVYSNLGIAYGYLEQEELALENSLKAMELFKELGIKSELATLSGTLASTYYQLGRFEEAKEYVEKALREFEDIPFVYRSSIYQVGTRTYVELKEYDRALEMFSLYEEIESNDTTLSAAYQEMLSKKARALAGLGRFEEAFDAQTRSTEMALAMNNLERIEYREKMQEEFNSKEREKELRISQLTLENKERQQSFFIGGLILAGMLIVLFIWLVRNKMRGNEKLREKNAIIQKSLEEKEVLLREIHHRVKNNLQVISSLLSIQSREIKDEVALEAVQESRNRVKSMSLIHQNLYKEDNLTGIDVGDYVEKLSRSLFSSYKVDADEVNLKTDVDHLNLDVDTTIPLGLILNELISNALKYAFVGREAGTLSVSLKEKDDMLELVVADDGVGVQIKNHENEDSFGMKMIDAFAQKLDAVWQVENDNGTTVKLQIRKFKKAS